MWGKMTRFVAMYAFIVWIKPRWKALSIALACLLSINYLHSEYIMYVEASNDTSFLVLSYKIKVFLNLLAVFGVIFSLTYNSSKSPKHQENPRSRSNPIPNETPKNRNLVTKNIPDQKRGDGFDFLRAKKVLDNKAKKILKK